MAVSSHQKRDPPDLKVCAGNNGTTTIIDEILHNASTLTSALRSSSEGYARTLDVMTKRLSGAKRLVPLSPELSTPSCSDASQVVRQRFYDSEDLEAWFGRPSFHRRKLPRQKDGVLVVHKSSVSAFSRIVILQNLTLNEEAIVKRISDAIQQKLAGIRVSASRKEGPVADRRGPLGSHDLTEIVKKHAFVGVIDLSRRLALIQRNKNVHMVNHCNRLDLDPSPSLRMLVKFAIDVEEYAARSGMSNDEIVDRIVKTLMDRREMLLEYFSLDISFQRLAILRRFRTRFATPLSVVSAAASDEDGEEKLKSEAWRIQIILFRAMRKYLAAPKFSLDSDIAQVASLPDLYRVFERC
ncbi:hypothetical protein C8R48DRAFT_793055 [Suillus tomentosus]|nr:hypothetical protein C8R48DRAFT_793044 [Suillus tomentosus]KAG1837019.1 hypothetical protein C8R48DRAFT_680411 [Suillus tomentosus]KAG1837023.1 hypothetical protein C8R48DRAFT_793055 [Suillus tomentosus]